MAQATRQTVVGTHTGILTQLPSPDIQKELVCEHRWSLRILFLHSIQPFCIEILWLSSLLFYFSLWLKTRFHLNWWWLTYSCIWRRILDFLGSTSQPYTRSRNTSLSSLINTGLSSTPHKVITIAAIRWKKNMKIRHTVKRKISPLFS